MDDHLEDGACHYFGWGRIRQSQKWRSIHEEMIIKTIDFQDSLEIVLRNGMLPFLLRLPSLPEPPRLVSRANEDDKDNDRPSQYDSGMEVMERVGR